MLDRYANQTLTWEKVTGVNSYNEKTYSTHSIKGRFVDRLKVIVNQQGEEELSTGQVFTVADVNANDRINGRIVQAVSRATSLGGQTEFKRCYLK